VASTTRISERRSTDGQAKRPGQQGAVCLAGGGACPPEDCGGIGGYADLQATLRRGCGREYRELLAWLGGPFDPTAFDLAVTNRALKRLR